MCVGGDWAKTNWRYLTNELKTTRCNPSCTHGQNYYHNHQQQRLTYGVELVSQIWPITPSSAATLGDGLAASSKYPRTPVTVTSMFASPSRPKGAPCWGQMMDHIRSSSSYPYWEIYSVNRQNNRVESSPGTIFWKGGREREENKE